MDQPNGISKQFSYNEIFNAKNNILIVSAHPDDIIVYFGALMDKLSRDGKSVSVVLVSNGARGSRDNEISESELSETRIKEEKAALKFLHIPEENLFSLDYKDGEVESNMKLIGEIAYFIRKSKADIVCTHEPTLQYQHTYNHDGFFVQHRDHRKVGEAVIDAVYPFSRDRSFFPEHYTKGVEPHSVFDLLLTDEKQCNFDFDYTDNLETKKSALRLHKSQFDENFINDIVNAVKFNDRYVEKFNYVKLLW
jgi:LmbE family N-acetylglucosaminyl deacetylase